MLLLGEGGSPRYFNGQFQKKIEIEGGLEAGTDPFPVTQ